MSLSPEETIGEKNWKLYPLFTITEKSKVRIWQIGFNEAESSLITITGELCLKEEFSNFDLEGLNDDFRSENVYEALKARENFSSRVTESIKTIRTNLGVVTPKAKRTLQEQAWQEAKQKDKLKREANFVDDLEGLLEGQVDLPFRLQLAEAYFFPDDELYNKNQLTDANLAEGVVCQIKKDGERFSCRRAETELEIRSRTNLPIDFLELQRAEMTKLLAHLPKGTVLDGELTHSKGREYVRGIISTSQRHNCMDQVIANIFDIIIPSSSVVLEDRIGYLQKAFEAYNKESNSLLLTKIENHTFNSVDEIRKFYEAALANEEEGIVIRKLAGIKLDSDSIYRGGRNHNLLKVKPVQYGEATIVAIEQATKAHSGCAKLKLKTPEGKVFGCVCHGDLEFRRQIYKNRNEYIGKKYEYKYKQETNKGTPSHATGVDFI